MDRIRWGMIGCGAVTEKKSGPALQQADRSELMAIASRTYSKAEDYAKRKGVPLCFEDPMDLLQCSDIDAVYIATAPDSHAKYTIAALEAGKAVYVEKPMARTYDECLRMIEKQKETGLPVFVAYYRRTLPYFLKVKELLDSGVIGEVQSIDVTLKHGWGELDSKNLPWRYIPEIAGGGLFVDLASHTLDIFDFYFGPLKLLEAKAENRLGHYPAEDFVEAAMALRDSTPVNGLWSFCEEQGTGVDEVIVHGSDGDIKFSSFWFSPIELRRNGIVEQYPVARNEPIQLPMIERIVACLLDGAPAVSTADDAARTSLILDGILHEYRLEHDIHFSTI